MTGDCVEEAVCSRTPSSPPTWVRPRRASSPAPARSELSASGRRSSSTRSTWRREPSADQDAVFQQQLDSLEAVGVRVHVETPLGYAPHAITQLALEHNAGIIVMGTRGQGLFHTGFSGSVSSDVVRLSPVPVLLVPAATGASAESGECGVRSTAFLGPRPGGPRLGRRACLRARVRARAYRVRRRVEILHVVEMSFEAVRENREARAREMLEVLAATARASGAAEVVTTIIRGRPDEEVRRLAATGRYSLVVLAPGCHDTIDRPSARSQARSSASQLRRCLLAPPRAATPPSTRAGRRRTSQQGSGVRCPRAPTGARPRA